MKPYGRSACGGSRSRGITLIEAMVALGIMAFGMLAVMALQLDLRRTAELARQRGAALRLAQQDLECLRSFGSIGAPGALSYASIESLAGARIDSPCEPVSGENDAVFTVARSVDEVDEPPMKLLQIDVRWHDRGGALQTLGLYSIIGRADPALAGSLHIAPIEGRLRRPAERAVQIPARARDLGDRRSVIKPLEHGTLAWVFDNVTAVITGKCTVPADRPTAALTAADLDGCTGNTFAYLLSGLIRFAPTAPPDPSRPAGTALPLDMRLALTSANHPLDPSWECFDDAPASDRNTMTAVTYQCLVYPNGDLPRIWSGRLSIAGIALGERDWKICRYSADLDGNGRIDNAEHPLDYDKVAGSLARQNFLVIRATESCPVGPAVDPARGVFGRVATVEHQPSGR